MNKSMTLNILGLDGLMEERGRSLSVGQRQLFCVARAVLSSAKVILFCFKPRPFLVSSIFPAYAGAMEISALYTYFESNFLTKNRRPQNSANNFICR